MDERQRQRLGKHYVDLDHDALLRQGREHLHGDAGWKARRLLGLVRLAMWTVVIGAVVGVAGMALYLLFLAKSAGEDFARLRDETLIELLDLNEE